MQRPGSGTADGALGQTREAPVKGRGGPGSRPASPRTAMVGCCGSRVPEQPSGSGRPEHENRVVQPARPGSWRVARSGHHAFRCVRASVDTRWSSCPRPELGQNAPRPVLVGASWSHRAVHLVAYFMGDERTQSRTELVGSAEQACKPMQVTRNAYRVRLQPGQVEDIVHRDPTGLVRSPKHLLEVVGVEEIAGVFEQVLDDTWIAAIQPDRPGKHPEECFGAREAEADAMLTQHARVEVPVEADTRYTPRHRTAHRPS